MNSEAFNIYVTQVLAPTLFSSDVLVLDNLTDFSIINVRVA